MYSEGPNALRERRLKRLRELGIVGPQVIAHEMINHLPDGGPYIQWEQMDDAQRAKSARAMECFAGMVDNIDQNVGRLLKYLEETGQRDGESTLLPLNRLSIQSRRHFHLLHVRQWLGGSGTRGARDHGQ